MNSSSTSTSESGATISIRGSRGSIGISPTGVELGINAGIGQLGISTDYGGGIVVGIGGQKIVWGREGGYIHYSLPGLEVIIEARDCVVVETRKVMGKIVASHTYPDPGCKLPPDPPKPPPGPSGGGLPPGGLSADQIDGAMPNRKCSGPCVLAHYWDMESAVWEQTAPGEGYYGGDWEPIAPPILLTEGLCYGSELFPATPYYPEFIEFGWKSYGSIVASSLTSFTQNSGDAFVEYFTVDSDTRESCFPGTPSTPLPPNGNRPPMPQDCCKELAADLADIREVLATKEILEGKLTFPWRVRMPGGTGDEVIKDYPNLARAIAQMIDHLGIHPPKLSIKDINNAIAGDQSIDNQFPSATQGFEALMAQVWDANADVDTLTNFLYRLSWLCVQQSVNLAVLSGDIQSIKDMLGGATERDSSSITTPFNIGAGIKEVSTKGKGFGKNQGNGIDKKIDENIEFSTESLLPEFLKIRENEIIIDKFSGKQDIYDMLSLIILKLETLSAR